MNNHKILRASKRGQIVLPLEFRKLLLIDENTDLSLRLSPDGAIEIRPVEIMPISNLLENNSELRTKVVQSIRSADNEEYLDEDESRKLLFDDAKI